MNIFSFTLQLYFRALLDRDKDEEMPNLIVLLCESFVAIYMSLLSYALATCDAHILYRLVGQNVANSLWSAVFGGKFLVKVAFIQMRSSIPQTDEPNYFPELEILKFA
jgi:hypothetical protein